VQGSLGNACFDSDLSEAVASALSSPPGEPSPTATRTRGAGCDHRAASPPTPGRRRRGRRTALQHLPIRRLRRITPIRLSLVSRQEGGRHDRSTYDTPAKLPSSGLAGHSRELVLTGRDCRDDRTRPPSEYETQEVPSSPAHPVPLLALGSPRWVSQVLATSV
jgi:hypothetical protein